MALPDYVLDPNAVTNDLDAAWRYNRAPNYSKTRAFFEEGSYYILHIRSISYSI